MCDYLLLGMYLVYSGIAPPKQESESEKIAGQLELDAKKIKYLTEVGSVLLYLIGKIDCLFITCCNAIMLSITGIFGFC